MGEKEIRARNLELKSDSQSGGLKPPIRVLSYDLVICIFIIVKLACMASQSPSKFGEHRAIAACRVWQD